MTDTTNQESHEQSEHLMQIESPADLRQLSHAQLPDLAQEIRQFLIETVSKTGGHLAAGLGVVELTLALHSVFDTPDDKLVWDVGHQSYPHKILTGRRDQLKTIRQKDGLCGFTNRSESEYDPFGAGHSSTSISAALGMAVAAQARGERREHIAVIGDGALSAGMAFEALNHAGSLDLDLLVILNDNDMSISSPVGGVSNYLARILSSRFYNRVRDGSQQALGSVPGVQRLMLRWEEHLKGMVIPGTLFEELGFTYIGPIDGHNLPLLLQTLDNMKAMRGPRFLHVVTQKGKGYAPAEGDPCSYHGVSPFDPESGEALEKSQNKTYTQVFSDWISDAATQDDRLVAITPAMCEGSGLTDFSQQYPERYFDVGIAEQHALTLAAGMACDGLKPVVAIYSTFLQRAYDQLLHDIVLQDLDVTLAVDRAGPVGADGATHAGSFDLSFARCLPGLAIMVPSDEAECYSLLQTAYAHQGPALVRFPRGEGTGATVEREQKILPWGKGEVQRSGSGIAFLAFGPTLAVALEAAEEFGATVANMRFVKPLDEQLIRELAETHPLLVTLEENAIMGGAGSAVSEFLAANGMQTQCMHLGLPDRFIEQGSQREQLEEAGLDLDSVVKQVRQTIDRLE